MESLSELDASFLYLESDRAPLNVGGAFVFKKKSPRSRFNFNRFREILYSKLGNERLFRHRVLESSLNLELPTWAEDPHFDIDNHIHYLSLSDLPGQSSLNELTATILSKPLDRDKPLWNVTYVEGLEKQSPYSKQHFALIINIHISAVDGNTGDDILSQLLKLAPEVHELPDEENWQPNPLPKSTNWLDEAYSNAFSIPKKLAHIAKDTAASAFYGVLAERLKGLNLPDALLKVAKTPVNQSVSNKRAVDTLVIPASQIRTIRQNLNDVTTNDVIMGICAEAICHYLSDNSKTLPKIPLIAMSPIAVRSTSLEVKSGNQLAASLFSLVTTEKDPIQRIRRIHESAQSSSHYDAAISAARLTELIPSCMAALSARVYSEFLLAQKHKPMFNLPITNIPGPQFPLYMEDNELISHTCASPLFDGLGIGITIVSYNGQYTLTTTYCPELVKTTESFSHYLEKALKTIDEGQLTASSETNLKPAPQTGLIEDAVGLVNNLFSNKEKADQ